MNDDRPIVGTTASGKPVYGFPRRDVSGPLNVECPTCGRKRGFPCQNLSGVATGRAWLEDEVRGGLIGYANTKHPHDERREAARDWAASIAATAGSSAEERGRER